MITFYTVSNSRTHIIRNNCINFYCLEMHLKMVTKNMMIREYLHKHSSICIVSQQWVKKRDLRKGLLLICVVLKKHFTMIWVADSLYSYQSSACFRFVLKRAGSLITKGESVLLLFLHCVHDIWLFQHNVTNYLCFYVTSHRLESSCANVL